MCVFVCISHTCRNLNFAKNVTTLLHWADNMKCSINSVKNSSSKNKKKIPTYLPYFCSARYANITIFFFWPKLSKSTYTSQFTWLKSTDWFKKGPSRSKWFRRKLQICIFSGLVTGWWLKLRAVHPYPTQSWVPPPPGLPTYQVSI